MNHKLFQEYLEKYTLEALGQAGDDVSGAADYLEKLKKAGMLVRNRTEKNAALDRARKNFSSSRERSLYVVLKSLGLDDLAKEIKTKIDVPPEQWAVDEAMEGVELNVAPQKK